MIRCTGIRRVAFFMDITVTTAICRCIYSLATNIDACAGALDEVKRIVGQLRESWPQVRITLRADSGFCRGELMAWSEANAVDYVFGLAKNERLKKKLTAGRERDTVFLRRFLPGLLRQPFRPNPAGVALL